MKHIRKIKIGASGERLPDDATNFVAIELPDHGLMFDANDSTESAVTDKEAKAACGDLRIAGFDNWRVPEDHELFLIRDPSRFNPAIDTHYFPTCKSAGYRTNTPDASAPRAFAWVVFFGDGDVALGHQYYRFRVRAVRSCVPAGQ